MKFLFGILSLVLLYGCEGTNLGLKEGDRAPDFALTSQDDVTVRLSDFQGRQNVILYFYPKDDTPGCTKEACSFRDDLSRFHELETEVIGVSVDDLASHKAFQSKYNLNFKLLADPDKQVTELYGVKSFFGLADRVTFVVDKQGIIRKIYPKVDVSQHSEEVLTFVRTLSRSE